MKETPNYYSIIPADVRYDINLKDKAKLLYSEITALSDKYGYCYASNKYFAELYNVSITTISLLIKDLIDNGYIESEIIYKEGTKEILNRYLKIVKGGYLRNLKEGYLRKVKDNNINNNITSNNNKENILKENVIKKSYGQFNNVLLTDEEYAKLEKSNLLSYIETLSSYIASKGKKYKSHYATILNWKNMDNKKQEENKYKGLSFKERENLRQQELLDKMLGGD